MLLQTGDTLIAEATRDDRTWGIGIDVGDPLVQIPSRWYGANILGWALMEVRAALRWRKRRGVRGVPARCFVGHPGTAPYVFMYSMRKLYPTPTPFTLKCDQIFVFMT